MIELGELLSDAVLFLFTILAGVTVYRLKRAERQAAALVGGATPDASSPGAAEAPENGSAGPLIRFWDFLAENRKARVLTELAVQVALIAWLVHRNDLAGIVVSALLLIALGAFACVMVYRSWRGVAR